MLMKERNLQDFPDYPEIFAFSLNQINLANRGSEIFLQHKSATQVKHHRITAAGLKKNKKEFSFSVSLNTLTAKK